MQHWNRVQTGGGCYLLRDIQASFTHLSNEQHVLISNLALS